MTRFSIPHHWRKFYRLSNIWFLGAAFLLVVLVIGLVLTWPAKKSSILADPRFLVYTPDLQDYPLVRRSLKDRAYRWWLRLRVRFRKTPPVTRSFSPTATNRYSIQVVRECAPITGLNYLLEKNVAKGYVLFGHSNTLSATNWVTRFTETLQTGLVEWYDFEAGVFRKESLLLVTNDSKNVLIIPRHMAHEFQ